MEAILNTPFVPVGGGILVVVYLAWWSWRITRDVINPYRDENDRLRSILSKRDAQLEEARHLHDDARTHAQRCAAERERMRIAMNLHGVPWDTTEPEAAT